MLIDANLTFAPSTTAVAGVAGTTLIGNQVDQWEAGLDCDLWLVVMAASPIVGNAGSTIRFQLASGASAAIPTTGSALVMSPDIAIGTVGIAAGALFSVQIPRSVGLLGGGSQRFLGLLATISGASITSGTISAFLAEDNGFWQATAQAAN
jgi:hypothetical protein